MKCRACYSEDTVKVGHLKPYVDYEFDVFESVLVATPDMLNMMRAFTTNYTLEPIHPTLFMRS